MVVSFMTLYLTQHLHFDIRQAGYVLGSFGVGALTGSFLGGKLSDRYGYYPVQTWSLILNGLALILILFVRDFWLMCAAVFAMSVISETFRPANSVAMQRHSTPETRTRSISLYRMSVNLGWAIAPATGGLLATLGWHWLFIVDGATCILAAWLLLRLLPKPAEVTSTAENDENVLLDGPVQNTHVTPYRSRTFLAFSVLTLLGALLFMQFLWTVPVFFKESYHWSEANIGLVAALNGFIVFLVEMPLIYRIDGRRPPLVYVRFGLLLYALSYLAFVTPAAPILAALAYILFISFGEIFVMPFSSNYVFSQAEKGHSGQYMALYSMTYAVANILAPLMGTQIIAAWGYTALWTVIATMAIVALVGFQLLERRSSHFNSSKLQVSSK
jgi:predicted MFS family arabinose efflux permease